MSRQATPAPQTPRPRARTAAPRGIKFSISHRLMLKSEACYYVSPNPRLQLQETLLLSDKLSNLPQQSFLLRMQLREQSLF